MTFQFADEEATFEAGDAFYVPAGHVPVHEPETRYLFSPTRDLEETSAVIMGNMQRMQQS